MKTKHIALIGGTVLIVVTTVSYLSFAGKKTVSTSNQKKTSTHAVHKPITAVTNHPKKPAKPITVKSKAIKSLPEKPVPVQVINKKSELFSLEYLKMQEFTISCIRDTELVAEGGMKVSIPAKAFSFANGQPVEGKVTIQVKEAFAPEDIVLAGLITKKGKELLESGGMYYLNARSNNQELTVAKDKQLTIEVPTSKKENGMELYEGKQTEAGLDWTNPVVLNNQERDLALATNEAAKVFNIKIKNKAADVKAEKKNVVNKDSLGWIKREVNFEGSFSAMRNGNFNDAKQDKKLSYLMNTNRLGWANIDRLYHDPRSRQITFVTEVDKNNEFDDVYITMMFESKRIYLPGYQKKDGTYSFTHGDYEEPVMPVGEHAVIMVSAYKDGQQYFSLEKIVIDDNMSVKLVPELMATVDIKELVNNSL